MENNIITFLIAKRTNDKEFFKTFDGATNFKNDANVVLLEDTKALRLVINKMHENAMFRIMIHAQFGRDGGKIEAYRLETIVNEIKAISGCNSIEPYFITRSSEVEKECLKKRSYFVKENGVLCCHTSNLSGNPKISSKPFIDEMNVFKKGGMPKTLSEIQGKKNIFIGSSIEGLNITRAIKQTFEHDANIHAVIWENVFEPNKTSIEAIEEVLEDFEYSVFVFRSDDKCYSRGKEKKIPRDNVILEYGMFLGRHSRKNTFFITPRNKKISLATDLLGITPLDYDEENKNDIDTVFTACNKIREALKK